MAKKTKKASDAKTAVKAPVAGAFSTVELAKKAPSGADAYVVAVTKGEEGVELPGSSLLDAALTRTIFESLSAVGATGAAEEITKVPAPKKARCQILGCSWPR